MTIYFARDELEEISQEKLANVAEYLGLPHNKNTSKAKLILLILDHQKKETLAMQSSSEPPRYSVRVQRIMDSMKGTNNE